MPDQYGNPTGADWLNLSTAIDRSAANDRVVKDEAEADLSDRYLTAMKQGHKININSPKYFAPAHLAASAKLHEEKMRDAKYASQLFENDKKEIALRHAELSTKFKNLLMLPQDQWQQGFIDIDQYSNPNGDDIIGIVKKDGKDYYRIKNANGEETISSTPAFTNEQIRDRAMAAMDPEGYAKYALGLKAKRRAHNAAEYQSGGDLYEDEEGNRATLYQVINQDGKIERVLMNEKGQKIPEGQHGKYSSVKDKKAQADLKNAQNKGLDSAADKAKKDEYTKRKDKSKFVEDGIARMAKTLADNADNGEMPMSPADEAYNRERLGKYFDQNILKSSPAQQPQTAIQGGGQQQTTVPQNQAPQPSDGAINMLEGSNQARRSIPYPGH